MVEHAHRLLEHKFSAAQFRGIENYEDGRSVWEVFQKENWTLDALEIGSGSGMIAASVLVSRNRAHKKAVEELGDKSAKPVTCRITCTDKNPNAVKVTTEVVSAASVNRLEATKENEKLARIA